MALKTIINEHQRLVILRLLSEVPGYDLNESILQDGLDAYGLDISRDALRTQLSWLAEQGLITVETVESTQKAMLTARGEDVATGRAHVPGVKRPRAGE
ncbi:ArsR family transcriptional regulator [Shewanella sp. WXL01]|uniref:VpaChn25_0724 family phage protein n=1 Tax=Shewanella sp. WXL01 TaxID=2709721 RepID=UPI0014382F0A|nr:ArsR family transcriptional regulator [Shewanella sp. WXL01]NKF51375.1 ArsR family transcriptional regulator [Shewanella sp. WXL01]